MSTIAEVSGLPPVFVVAGSTASGKSDLALEIAGRFSGEIVNCDSVQLCRYLDVGTAKTPESERRGIPHHLIDILEPWQHFTAGDYARAARPVLVEIASRGKVPVIVGGTGFYLRALLEGLSEGPGRDPGLRERLAARKPGSPHRLLSRFDPAAARRIHPNDSNKVIRALEVCLLTRQPMTKLFEANPIRKLEGFRVLKVGLEPDRDALAKRIDLRCRAMFESGLLQEVSNVLAMGCPRDAKALQSIGYREAVLCLDGSLSPQAALDQTIIATRQYAKRQRTWFRREPDLFRIPGFGADAGVKQLAVHHLEVGIK